MKKKLLLCGLAVASIACAIYLKRRKRFHNPDGDDAKGLRETARWMAHREPEPWAPIAEIPPGPVPPRRIPGAGLRITFINHSTFLIQTEGLNILTDPIWSERASPFQPVGPMRQRAPGLRLEDLPPIDLVIVSHNHYDHLDTDTLRHLAREHRPRFVTALGNAKFLPGRATEMNWWAETPISEGFTLACVPAKHFSARGPLDRNVVLWCGWVLLGSRGAIYFAGDSGYGAHFAEIRARYGPFRAAMLPIGAYEPRWFMRPIHMSPQDAVNAHRDLKSPCSIAMHFGTFPLADEAGDKPLRELRETGISPREFWALEHGEGLEIPPAAPG